MTFHSPRNRRLGRLAGICLFAALHPAPLSAQNAAPAKSVQDMLHELTNEVRLLRNSFNQNAARQGRVQIELERYRAQNERVTLASKRLEDTHTELAAVIDALPGLTRQVQELEAQLNMATPEQRPSVEASFKNAQANIDQQKQRESQLREHEARLSDAIRFEQSRLDEISRRLDTVIVQLEAQEAGK